MHQDQGLTTLQAARVLNSSRTHLLALLEAGDIAYGAGGPPDRVCAGSLMAYRRRDDQRRREAADELTALNHDLGLY